MTKWSWNVKNEPPLSCRSFIKYKTHQNRANCLDMSNLGVLHYFWHDPYAKTGQESDDFLLFAWYHDKGPFNKFNISVKGNHFLWPTPQLPYRITKLAKSGSGHAQTSPKIRTNDREWPPCKPLKNKVANPWAWTMYDVLHITPAFLSSYFRPGSLHEAWECNSSPQSTPRLQEKTLNSAD